MATAKINAKNLSLALMLCTQNPPPHVVSSVVVRQVFNTVV